MAEANFRATKFQQFLFPNKILHFIRKIDKSRSREITIFRWKNFELVDARANFDHQVFLPRRFVRQER